MLTIDAVIAAWPAPRAAFRQRVAAMSPSPSRYRLIPMVGFAGAAIDYSHANSIKADMQSALDSTALMISKTAATMSAAQIQTAAQTRFFGAVHE